MPPEHTLFDKVMEILSPKSAGAEVISKDKATANIRKSIGNQEGAYRNKANLDPFTKLLYAIILKKAEESKKKISTEMVSYRDLPGETVARNVRDSIAFNSGYSFLNYPNSPTAQNTFVHELLHSLLGEYYTTNLGGRGSPYQHHKVIDYILGNNELGQENTTKPLSLEKRVPFMESKNNPNWGPDSTLGFMKELFKDTPLQHGVIQSQPEGAYLRDTLGSLGKR